MITLFEEHTYEVSPDEYKAVEFIVNFLKGKTNLPKPVPHKPIPAPKLVSLINRELPNLKKKFSEVRLRKCINLIRRNSLCFVCSSSKGYWEAATIAEMDEIIKSIEERGNAILASAAGLRTIKYSEEKKLTKPKTGLF
jgi:hypothetical protein